MALNALCIVAFLCLTITYRYCLACDEAVCASLVSKCLLLKSCECNMTDRRNCTCCMDCHRCLSRLYTDCCSCVGMCPEKQPGGSLQKASSVEELSDPIPDLFDMLTSELDPQVRWTTHTYPAHLDLLYFNPNNTLLDPQLTATEAVPTSREVRRHGNHWIVVDTETPAPNCTVAYMSTCQSLSRCRDSCQAMGAARYRWFHADGCCECIGSTCLDYGKGESLCMNCPAQHDDELDDVDELDYYDVHEAEKYTEHGAAGDDSSVENH